MDRTIISDIADKTGLEQDAVRDVVAEFALQLHRNALEYSAGYGDFIGADLWYQVGDQAFYHLLGFVEYFAERYDWESGDATEYLRRLGSPSEWEPFRRQMEGWRIADSNRKISFAHPGKHKAFHDEELDLKEMELKDEIIREVAKERCRKISGAVILELQKMKEAMQSGDDTPLRNVWDEICVQVQDEESVMWDAYLDTIQSLIEYRVEKIDLPTKRIIWFQAKDYNGYYDSQEEPVFSEDAIVKYILNDFLLPAAGNWTNKRIEKYLEMYYE